MKQIIFSILFLGLIWNSNAQNPAAKGKKGHAKSMEDRTAKAIAKLDSVLAFTPEQKAKVSELVQKRKAAVMEIRKKYADANGKLSEENKKVFRAEVKPMRQQFQADFKAILNSEQQAKFEALKAKKKEQVKSKKQTLTEEEEELFD